ncbi:TonB-dependent receptor [Phenylobacterium sp. SCN 70-31]|uniref:TonB-dependent receptor domain-containing protein n=1 Tax=Phenylobacterium sp. SCN 70-31 TaxID=1660129 RepID=UPI00086CDBB3|nr:TonB-dependent receptor [Phenylobacterium sp. SCN 70-31]ODT89911.1 MAG: hypothetical protein ABS78_00835 [Phenylobacterium sp. SCN 70-31]
MKKLQRLRSILLLGAALPTAAWAQAAPSEVEELVVTGSLIAGTPADAPSPVTVIGREQIQAQGAATIWDVVKNLESNQGSTTNSNPDENGTIEGTANINLRNLGQNSTLTLVNGKRQVVAAALTQDGSEFVDINALPAVMIERIEVLTDGGSAIYGSDAVAGVVNLIMRDRFDGLELSVGRHVMSSGSNPADTTFSAVAGRSLNAGRTRIVVGGEYFERDAVRLRDTPGFDPSSTQVFNSVSKVAGILSGTPNPIWINQPLTTLRRSLDPSFGATSVLYTDPLCSQLGFTADRAFDPSQKASTPGSDCGQDITHLRFVNPAQKRFSGAVSFAHEVSDSLKLYGFAQYAHNSVRRADTGGMRSQGPALILPTGSPIFGLGSRSTGALNPSLAPPVIGNVPNDRANGGLGVPALVYFNTDFPFSGGDDSRNTSTTRGLQFGLKGDFPAFGRSFRYDFSYSYSDTRLKRVERTINRYNAELAINGLGGPRCVPNGVTTYNLNSDPFFGNATLNNILFREYQPGFPQSLRETVSLAVTSTNQGQGDCHFLNPYLTALSNPALANDREMLDWISPLVPASDRRNELQSFDLVVSGDLFDLPGGQAAFAVGLQRREEDKRALSYDLVEPGLQTLVTYASSSRPATFRYAANDAFFGGYFTRSFRDRRTVDAAFAELQLPFLESIQTQWAIRYEDYGGGIGAETTPKVAVRWQALEALAFRASYSKSFRAPNTGIVFNGNGADSAMVIDRLSSQDVRAGLRPATVQNGQNTSIFFRSLASPNVKSETADTYNVGLIFQPRGGALDGLYVSVDYWRFDFSDRVVPQPIVQALDAEVARFNAAVGNPANYVEAASTALGVANPYVACNPNALRAGLVRRDCIVDPRLYATDGVSRALTQAATLQTVDIVSVNAGRVLTDGVDVAARYRFGTDWGDILLEGGFTYVNQYKIRGLPGFEDGFLGTGVTDAAGTTGDGKIARSLPDKKGHVSATWSRGPAAANGTVRYVSGYDNLAYEATIDDAQPGILALATRRFDSYVTFDVQFAYDFAEWRGGVEGPRLTVGVLNLFQNKPPYFVENDQRYDPTVYDPRGRRFYLNVSQRF